MTRFCGRCGSEITEDQLRFCTKCGGSLVAAPEHPQPAFQQRPLPSQPSDSAPQGENTAVIICAAVGFFVSAALLTIVGLLQLNGRSVSDLISDKIDLEVFGYLNLMSAGFYVLLGVGILRRKEWAWDWGLIQTAWNVVVGIMALLGGELGELLLLPLQIGVAACLYVTRQKGIDHHKYSGRTFTSSEMLSNLPSPDHNSFVKPPEQALFANVLPGQLTGISSKTIMGVLLALILLAGVSYVSPWICLYNLRQALLSGDESAIDRYVDFPSIRTAVKANAKRYAATLAKDLDKSEYGQLLSRPLVDGFLNSAVIENIVNAHTLAMLFHGGEEYTLLKPVTEKLKAALQSNSLNSASTLGYDGLSTFVIHSSLPETGGIVVDIIFKRNVLFLWQLSDIRIVSTTAVNKSSNLKEAEVTSRTDEAEVTSRTDEAEVTSRADEAEVASRADEAEAQRKIDEAEVKKVVAAVLISQPKPVYPALAKAARVQGTVKFEATIDKSGGVSNLRLLEGDPLLVQAAMEAVRQWKYRPSTVDGKSVEVITTVDVTFGLSQ